MEEESIVILLTINQELDHVFLLFPQRRCGFLFGTWSAKKNHRDRSSYHKAKILLQREMQKPENFWHTTRSMQHSLILKWLKFFSLLIINAVAGTEEEEDTVGLFIGILGKTNFHEVRRLFSNSEIIFVYWLDIDSF